MADQAVPYPTLDTPAVLVDMDRLEANISEMSRLAAEAGVRLRPHVKVHESAVVARRQIEAGAVGIEVGPVAQAEAMARQGLNDILIAHPGYYGGQKGEALSRLLKRPGLKLAAVVDMLAQAEIMAAVARSAGRRLPLLIKVDLGRSSRYGVPPGAPLLALARQLGELPGVEFAGIYAHEMGAVPTPEGLAGEARKALAIMTDSARMLRREGISAGQVSVGASPTFRATCRYLGEGQFPEITEIHPGQCVIGDILYHKMGGNPAEAIAITVLTTVMSTSHPDWATIDAGYKTFGADPLIAFRDTPDWLWQGRPGYGWVKGRPDLWFGRLAAETGCLYYRDNRSGQRLRLGQRLEIVPNNATLVINLHERLFGVRNGMVEREIPVSGRGQGS